MKRTIWGSALVLAIGVVACGDDVVVVVADAMSETADAMRDSTSDAVAMDDVSEARDSSTPTARTELTAPCEMIDFSYWALFDLDLPTDSVPDIHATVCGAVGRAPAGPGSPFEGLICSASSRIDYGNGRVKVACLGFDTDPTAIARISVQLE